ncbi:SURF1 family cytochrome oxidase biogenesis protein [Microbacterium gorillae]|uniref:SURF1 family cytochrome oxidase biogenesis protein n=1 Tax=Microbacterium gorillae TaxID=1231063 RepID=UPI000590CFE2|nr:SURF1 family protein [Microbacterium gorillae]
MPKNTAARWTLYVAIAIVFAIVCAFLSDWQFTRNETRAEANHLIEANYDAKPVPLAEAIPVGGAFRAADEWQRVEVTGHYLTDAQLLARNRPLGGTSAFEVLVPFQTDDGRIFVVDRGWVPPADNDSVPSAVPAAPSGEVTVTMRLRPSEGLPVSGRSSAPKGQVPTINLPLVGEQTGLAVETSAYGLMATESPAPANRPQALDEPTIDPGPHLSYAIQWILFAVMGFVFIFYMIRTERKHRREDAEDAAALAAGETPTVRVKAKRKDRDADDEDALLDSSAR